MTDRSFHASGWPGRGRALAALGATAASLALAACGSGSSSSGSGAATAADNALKFSRCMRQHGVKNFPDPELSGGHAKLTFKAGPGSTSPQTVEAAQAACRHFQAASEPKLTPQERVAREEDVLRFARCMREHGVNIHASTQGGGVQIRLQAHDTSGGPNPESPAFQSAQKACQGLLPGKGAPGAGPSTSTGHGPGKGAGLALGG